MSVAFAKFKPSEQVLVNRIVARAAKLFEGRASGDIHLDIAAVHVTCPLRLADLAEADDFNFAHDVDGIWRHLDRETGELKDCFCPRFSMND